MAVVSTVMLLLVVVLDARVTKPDRYSDAITEGRERLAAVTREIDAAVRARADGVSGSDKPLAELQSIVVHVVNGHRGISHKDFKGADPKDRQVDVVLVVAEEFDRDMGGNTTTVRIGSCVRFGLSGFTGIDCGAVWELIDSYSERPQILIPGGTG